MQYKSSLVFALTALLGLTQAAPDKRQVNIGGNSVSCPGVLNIQSSSTVCCVGGNLSIAPLSLSSCAGWPMCTGPVTISSSSTPENPPLTCAVVLNVSDPSYSSKLASATSSLAASGTSYHTTINPTGASASPGSTASSSRASASSSGASVTSAAASSASSAAHNGANALYDSGRTLAGVALAGAVGAAGLILQ